MQSDSSDQNIKDFIEKLGLKKYSIDLLKIAFTHSSYTKEKNMDYEYCYERLEFLGDAVLKMAITDYLYKNFPKYHEGNLTKIRGIVVSDEILFKVAQKLDIEKFIKVGKAEEKNGSRKLESIQACVMEAMFGALYLSSETKQVHKFIITLLEPIIKEIAENKTIYNAKALLQEYTQEKSKLLPEYKLVKETGAAHNKTFHIKVYYKGEELAQASGKTKKQAQQEAAYIACQKLGLINKENIND